MSTRAKLHIQVLKDGSNLVAEKRFGTRLKRFPATRSTMCACLWRSNGDAARSSAHRKSVRAAPFMRRSTFFWVTNPRSIFVKSWRWKSVSPLLGRKGATIKHLYSHAMPFEH
jgi:hypothetical protein